MIEGRKRFLNYLSEAGVAVKQEQQKIEEVPVVLPEEEIKIKEIEEIVETAEPESDG